MKKIGLALIGLLIVIIASGAWACAGFSNSSQSARGISTSGFIEATDVSIAPEVAGRIISIAVAEGDSARANVPLVKLDDSLLQAQLAQAEAAVTQAQVAAEQAQALAEQSQAAVAQASMSRNLAAANRDGAKKAWDNALDLQKRPLTLEAAVIAAQGQVEIAQNNLTLATDNFRKITYPYTYSTFAFDIPTAAGYITDAQSQVAQAQKALLQSGLTADEYAAISRQLQQALDNLNKGQELLNRGQGQDVFTSGILRTGDFWTLRAAQTAMDTARATLDTANKTLQNALDIKNNPQQINAAVDSAHSAYDSAVSALSVAESAVTVAQKQVVVAQRQAGVAQKQVDQSRAALNVIKVQLSRTSLSSPLAGVVRSRNAEVGEVAQPGAPILIITQMDKVTLTAYVPERWIGLVKLGEGVQVSVDSYPNETFAGEVTFISPQAIFTPGNVQLKDEREKTVFAVKVSLANPDHKLKPGMPADALIMTNR